MNNIFLHTHLGGDGAHFLIWLLHEACYGKGDQWDRKYHPLPYNKNNDYRWISSAIYSDKEIYKHLHTTDIIDNNIRSNKVWHTDLELTSIYNTSEIFIQQTHAWPSECSRATVPSGLIVTTAKIETVYYYTRLDIIKNQLKNIKYDDEYFENWACKSHEYITGAAGKPIDDLPVYYIDYDKLFFEYDIEQFFGLAKFLGLVIKTTATEIKKHIEDYNSRNIAILEKRGSEFNKEHQDKLVKAYHDFVEWTIQDQINRERKKLGLNILDKTQPV